MKEAILLLHGLLMNPAEMGYVNYQLQKAHYDVHALGYQTVFKTTEQNVDLILKKLKERNLKEFHIVAHSLGGLVAINLLDRIKKEKLPFNVNKIVLLGSPIKGSKIAKELIDNKALKFIVKNAYPNALDGTAPLEILEDFDTLMISGDKRRGLSFLIGGFNQTTLKDVIRNIEPDENSLDHDGTVLLSETQSEFIDQQQTIDDSHTSMLFSKDVTDRIINFLKTNNDTS